MTTETTSEWVSPDDETPPADGESHDGETPPADGETPPAADESSEMEDDDDTPAGGDDEISQLRNEAAKRRRQRNEERDRADSLSRRLFTELVRNTGVLIDPDDMPFNAELLDDPEALRTAAEEYAESKPHLRARRYTPAGGNHRQDTPAVSLGSILRGNA